MYVDMRLLVYYVQWYSDMYCSLQNECMDFLCFFCQAAMVFFELAWVLSKDTKDMLW